MGNYFINELLDYSKCSKAELVYKKCLRAGKNNLACKIKNKYGLQQPHDDMLIAFEFALNSIKK